MLRAMVYRLHELHFHDEAIVFLRRIKDMRPEEAQAWRDLALALAARGDRTSEKSAAADYRESLQLLEHVLTVKWHRWRDFNGIELVALEEYNSIQKKLPGHPHVLPQAQQVLDADLRVVISWDSDMTDIDLHILEPDGSDVYYRNRDSKSGGHLSKDMTRGLGPEVYFIRRAQLGSYKLKCRFYGNYSLKLRGGINVKIDYYTNYGRVEEKHFSRSVRLKSESEMIDLGEIILAPQQKVEREK